MKKYKVAVSIILIGLMIVAGLPVVASTSPSNDHFADAYVIFGASGTTTGHNEGATAETGEPAQDGANSVWWSWTAPLSGGYAFDTFGSDFDTVLQIYTGTSVSGLTEITSNNDSGNVGQSGVFFDAVAGETYMICVRGYNDWCFGNITLNWLRWNDNFADALPISGTSGATSGHNVEATSEVGDSITNYAAGATVWWAWTAPQTGYATFGAVSSLADLIIGICTGPELGSLSLIAFNDDISDDLESRTTFLATEGTTYYILIDSYGSYGGPIALNWLYEEASNIPVNDDFSDAYVITGEMGTTSSNNEFATREAGEPANQYLGFSSVWWSWTAPLDGDYYWDTEGSMAMGEDYKNDYFGISIYTGDAVDQLTRVAQGGSGEAVTLTAVAGTTYHIAIDSEYSSFWSMGDIVLNWGMSASPSFTSADHASFAVGITGTFEVTVEGYPVPYVWKYGGILPSGMFFTEKSGCATINGTPLPGSAGIYILSLEAWNTFGRAYQTFTLTVTEAPTITSGNSATFNTGSNGSFKVTTTGFPTPTVSLSSGSLPAGVIFNETTATFSGAPESGTAGTYELTLTADNGIEPAAIQNFTLTVLNQHAPLISLDPQNAVVVQGEPATFTVEYSANPAAYIQWQYSTDGVRWRNITGANSDTYTTPATKKSMNGYLYRVVLSNTFGPTTSEAAKLTVMPSSFTTVDLQISHEYGVYDPETNVIAWVIHVTNQSSEPAKDVVVTDSLARGTKYVSIDGDIIPSATVNVRGSKVNVNLGEMAANSSVVFTIYAGVARATSPVENTVEVKTTSFDINMENNISQAVCTF